jgi:16S rRNA (cytosine967-C5)-methyltransferase
MTVSPARRAAYATVLRVFEDAAYADRALRSAAERLDGRDRAFAQRLAYGTIQRVRTIDHALEELGKRPVRKLDPPVRAALRLGAYELGWLETAPHAAVNETVELVRAARLHQRGAAPRRGGDCTAARGAARWSAEGVLPGLDRADLVA